MEFTAHAQMLRLAALLVFAGGITGCTTYSSHNYLSYHTIPVSADGKLDEFGFQDPEGADGRAVPRGKDLPEHIGLVLERAEVETRRRRGGSSAGSDNPIPLLIAVHGGLNTANGAAARADRLLTLIGREPIDPEAPPFVGQARDRVVPDQWHYPVFLHWKSGPVTTVLGRLTRLRQGRDLDFVGLVTSPLLLVHDVARGLTRLPRSLFYGLYRDAAVASKVAWGATPFRTWDDADRIADAMSLPDHPDEDLRYYVRKASYERDFLTHAGRLLAYFPMQVPKVLTQGFALEGLGQGAWDVMRRRASHLVRTPETYERNTENMGSRKLRQIYSQQGGDGALPILYRSMVEQNDHFSVTLVAHSMGAIAINESLTDLLRAVESSGGRVTVERIIYMAPACSVIEGANALVPFLRASKETQFHFLTLHPVAEADEIFPTDAVPRGSLLEWIDVFYNRQATHGERVFGKWANAIPAIGLFEPVRTQVHFKAFDVKPGSSPQKHGHFFEIPFWRQAAYAIDGAPYFEANWLEASCAETEQECKDLGVTLDSW